MNVGSTRARYKPSAYVGTLRLRKSLTTVKRSVFTENCWIWLPYSVAVYAIRPDESFVLPPAK